jgi:hypothetical protein
MWLAYLRFDTARETRIALVRCDNKAETDEALRVAKGLFGPALTEYATFYAGRTIHPKQVPNFAEELIFTHESFLRACGVTPGQPGPEGGTATRHPPGSAGQPPPALPGGGQMLLGSG